MKSITTAITIQANPEQVWAVLTDFSQYPRWNPFIQKITGDPILGSILENHIYLDDNKPQIFKPEIIILEENSHFAWIGKLFFKGLFDGEHHFKLTRQEDGSTQLVHEEFFTGILVGLIFSMIKEKTREGFEAMNTALAEEVKRKTRVGNADLAK